MGKNDFKEKSYWMTTREYSPGEHLQGDIEVDVAIVGGGFTGLSSAYHIKKAEPNLRVALLESQVVGFGASGRNGGFNMTLFGLTLSITALRFSKAKAREAHLYMDLILERKTDLTDVFFVNRKTIPWPPEPLRNLTIKAILGYMHWEDRIYDAAKSL